MTFAGGSGAGSLAQTARLMPEGRRAAARKPRGLRRAPCDSLRPRSEPAPYPTWPRAPPRRHALRPPARAAAASDGLAAVPRAHAVRGAGRLLPGRGRVRRRAALEPLVRLHRRRGAVGHVARAHARLVRAGHVGHGRVPPRVRGRVRAGRGLAHAAQAGRLAPRQDGALARVQRARAGDAPAVRRDRRRRARDVALADARGEPHGGGARADAALPVVELAALLEPGRDAARREDVRLRRQHAPRALARRALRAGALGQGRERREEPARERAVRAHALERPRLQESRDRLLLRRPAAPRGRRRRARLPRARALVRDPALVCRALGRRARRRARDAARVARGRAARALRPVRASKASARARPCYPSGEVRPRPVVLVVVVVSLSLSQVRAARRAAAATTCSASRGRTTPARRSCTAR